MRQSRKRSRVPNEPTKRRVQQRCSTLNVQSDLDNGVHSPAQESASHAKEECSRQNRKRTRSENEATPKRVRQRHPALEPPSISSSGVHNLAEGSKSNAPEECLRQTGKRNRGANQFAPNLILT